MDKLRIVEKNKANLQLKSLETNIKRNSDTISRLKAQESSTFNKNQIEKLSKIISDNEKQADELREKIKQINNGNFDIEISNHNKEHKVEAKKNFELTEKKNNEKTKKKKDEEQRVKNFISHDKLNNKSQINEYSIQKDTERFFKNVSNIPDYMSSNLKEMTCNKAYIWKGIWCFGDIDIKKYQQLIIFEKIRGGNMIVSEISDTHVSKYEKQGGKQGKKFISKTNRN
jgi:hypothetical protein